MQDIFFANIEEIKLKCVQNSLIQTTIVIVNNYSNLMPLCKHVSKLTNTTRYTRLHMFARRF